MLDFEPYSLETLKKYLPFIQRRPGSCSDISAGMFFMWHEGLNVSFCVRRNTFVARQDTGGQPAFSWPTGEDPDGLVDELMVYVRENDLPLRFFAVDDETLERIRSDARFHGLRAAFEPRWSDYLYDFESAATFKGRKFSGQRNHVNKFRRLYGEPEVRALAPGDEPLLLRLLEEYRSEHADGDMLEQIELEKSRELLVRHQALNLIAAGLFAGGELAAFSVGEIIGDMLVIHVEKALLRFEGAYPAMYQGFVKLVWDMLGHPLRLVNREDDSGDPGLRTSKQQYQPVGMANKHLVHVDAPAARLDRLPVLRAGGAALTPLREEDKAAYLRLNTDVENNRFWGYDYREDIYLHRPVSEDSFYDGVQYDIAAGDSINFAVRLSEEGELIGEVILWNFTSTGRAEIGCRLTPSCQGRGLGRAAFAAAVNFARDGLGLKPWARCMIQNAASRRMIEAGGLRLVRQDEAYMYFE